MPLSASPQAPSRRVAIAPHSAADPELRSLLEPMLEAVARMASADAAVLRVARDDGVTAEAVAAVGRGLAFDEHGNALPGWCAACGESRLHDSACVRLALRGDDRRIPGDALGAVCKHIATVPLRHRERPVGVLHLLFAAECALPADLAPLLQATGDLIGVTLDNARLARENLRIRLGAERQMMAGEMHDALAQGLTYMRMRMSLLRDAILRCDEPVASRIWSDVDETLGNSHRRLRELITYFRAQMDPRGLGHALRELAEQFPDRSGVALDYRPDVAELWVSPEREIEVFHIVQEALANVARHARAKRASLLVERTSAEYRVVVEDDGIGIPTNVSGTDISGHYGLAIMRERALRLGGRLNINAAAGQTGTRVELVIPIEANPADSSL